MRIVIDIWKLSLAFAITWIWSKWYLPISYTFTRYYSTGELTISLLWIVHLSFRLPMRSSAEIAKQYLPNTYR